MRGLKEAHRSPWEGEIEKTLWQIRSMWRQELSIRMGQKRRGRVHTNTAGIGGLW